MNWKDDIWGIRKGENLKCMDCGKPISRKRKAPSGSFLPRCEECNAKRWKEYRKACADPHSAVGSDYPRASGEPDPLEDPWG